VNRPDLEADAKLTLADVLIYSAGDEDQPAIDAAIETAVQTYTAIGNTNGRLRAQLSALEWLYQTGRMTPMLEQGLALADEALAAGERAVAARALARFSAAAIWTGHLDLAVEMLDRADVLIAEIGLLATARIARFYRARLSWVTAQFAEADALLNDLLRDSQAAGDGTLLIASLRLFAESMLAQNRLADAQPYLDRAIDESKRRGERWSRTELLAYKAAAVARMGQIPLAAELLADANEVLRESDYAANAVYNYALGVVRWAQGRYDDAEAAFRLALGVVAPTDNWSWISATLDLAMFLIDRGRFDEAAPLVAKAAAALEGTRLNVDRPRLQEMQGQLAAARTAGGAPSQPG
jgi:tetratricopeptide (TPR) repeat protein